jgi:hypothetical protein
MMQALQTIAAGRPDPALLGNCRLEWGEGEAYGEEAILELFRAAPMALGQGVTIATPTALAWIGAEEALVADLYDGHVGRLWRMGAGPAPAPEPAVAVAFDPDLHQQRGAVLFRAEDHPELDPAAAPDVLAAGGLLLDGVMDGAMHRARAFVLRAFTGPAGTVALFAIHRLTGGAVRGAGFLHAAALIEGGATRLVIDGAASASVKPWVPRL